MRPSAPSQCSATVDLFMNTVCFFYLWCRSIWTILLSFIFMFICWWSTAGHRHTYQWNQIEILMGEVQGDCRTIPSPFRLYQDFASLRAEFPKRSSCVLIPGICDN